LDTLLRQRRQGGAGHRTDAGDGGDREFIGLLRRAGIDPRDGSLLAEDIIAAAQEQEAFELRQAARIGYYAGIASGAFGGGDKVLDGLRKLAFGDRPAGPRIVDKWTYHKATGMPLAEIDRWVEAGQPLELDW
jgi:hypothetical protein